jgi:hypothetical protein
MRCKTTVKAIDAYLGIFFASKEFLLNYFGFFEFIYFYFPIKVVIILKILLKLNYSHLMNIIIGQNSRNIKK